MTTYNKEEVMKALARRESKMYHYYEAVFNHDFEGGYDMSNDDEIISLVDAAYKAGKETRIEHCAEPECPECNITAYKAGVEDCIAIVEECSDFADSGHTLKMRIINQIQALK